jgi:hypothetical protein
MDSGSSVEIRARKGVPDWLGALGDLINANDQTWALTSDNGQQSPVI